MTRSRKHTPVTGIAVANSDKPYKVAEHRRERRKIKSKLKDEDDILPGSKEFGDPWKSPKDGKRYWDKVLTDRMPQLLRK